MPAITPFTGANPASLADALLAQNSGIQIVPNSVSLNASAAAAVGTYDGSLSPLGIGAGILLTTGTMPGTANTSTGFGQSNNGAGSALIDQVINPVFNTASFDATTLSFNFTVTDPTATSVSFNIVFGSDEYPEWVDAFVDAGVVFVNGVNYALFNHDPMHPLSVVSQNLQAGYFQNNAGGALPIEYDGVSKVLTIVAPIVQGGVNTITIGVADCGDHILDSGLFLSGLRAGNLPGSGVVIGGSDQSTSGNDTATGSELSDLFSMDDGDDVVFAAGGDDICAGDAGNDTLFGGSGDDALTGGTGDDSLDGGSGGDSAQFAGASTDYAIAFDAASGSYTVAATAAPVLAEGTDTLTGIETVTFSDGTFNLTPTGLTAVVPVLPPVNTAGTAVINGVAATGSVLTAAVSDVDGAPAVGAMSFDWQVSTDNGLTWASTGISGDAYTVQPDDAGAMFRVLVGYTDDAGGAELVMSLPKQVPAEPTNSLTVDLLNLDAPVGATTMNPLTTLAARAIDLGLSPNAAEAAIKAALGIDPAIKLLSFDSYAAAVANPADALALRVETIAVQVAVLTSLSNDDTGSKLALALVQAQAAGVVLDLADVDVLSALTGVPPIEDPATGKFPQPLAEIYDRNVNLAEAATLADVEKEWQDLLSIEDQIASTSIADLSVHINQAPAGFPVGTLSGVQDEPVVMALADLLNGLSDPEGSALGIVSMAADKPGTLTQNTDGSWSFTADAGFSGPVELTYTVADPMGASMTVSKLLIIEAGAPVNAAPVVSGPVTATVSEGGTVMADLLATASDADGDGLTVVPPAVLAEGFAFDPATGSATFDASGPAYQHLAAGQTLVVSQTYDVTDGTASTTGTIAVTVTGANDAAVIAGTQTGQTTEDRALVAKGVLTIADPDAGEAAFVAGTLAGTYGTATLSANGAWSYVLNTLNPAVQALSAGQTLTDTLIVQSLDGTTATLSVGVNGLAEAAGGPAIYGTILANSIAGTAGADVIYGLDGKDSIVGGDGDDILDGGAGFDVVNAGGGDDIIHIGGGTEAVGNKQYDAVMGDTGYDTVIVDGAAATYQVTNIVVAPGVSQIKLSNLQTAQYALMTGIEALEFADGTRVEFVPANHAPTGAATAVLSGTEDVAVSISLSELLAGFSDSDGDMLSVSGLSASAGALLDNMDGTWTFSPDADFSGAVTLSYLVGDGNGGTIAATNTLTLAAVNDAAIIAGSAAGSVTEDGVVQAAGTLTVTDADAGEAVFAAATLAGTYGVAVLTAGGDWTYTLNNASAAVQALIGGAVVVDSLTVATLDGTTASLVISITGADEPAAPGLTLTGTATANVLSGGAGNDTLSGLDGKDTLVGNAGDDILDGGAGSDRMVGGAGDDTYMVDNKGDRVIESVADGLDTVLTTLAAFTLGADIEALAYQGAGDFKGKGNALDNLISGGAGNDTLLGDAGTDALSGGLGTDKLNGGSGADVLSGGGGADFFVFSTAADAFDTVSDFEHLVDDIDLHLIDANTGKTGNQAFTFIDNAAFGLTPGQLRVVIDGDGAHVEGDVDGDGIADLALFLAGAAIVTAEDFIL